MGTEVETSQGLLACSHKKLQGTYSLLELLKEGVWPSQHLDFDPEVLIFGGFPGGSVVRNLPANAGDVGLIPGSGRSPGERNGNSCQYSCLEIPWTEEPGRLKSGESKRVGHDLATKQEISG